ncbi:MAG TPA: peptidoglycan-associated lipoprotein Pal [Steroidobacteraceae bacterium]|jgi:peptidoglycan-associated lipoprotein|nr:peptidoglycan-associated lipoprotein Pal [Steroidobacteraceae bacterium]
MKRMLSIAVLIAAAALLAGCPKKHNVNDSPVAGTQVPDSSANAEGASTSTSPLAGDANSTSRGYAGEGTGPLARKIIYFDFDKSEIKPEYAEIVTFTAHALTANSHLKLKLEGNTDERGTREYNIGLGERRAQAVRRALMLQGVAESQVSTVSFGAERPAAEGDDEAAWAKNRRVEVVFLP